jgi:hypothetical protein
MTVAAAVVAMLVRPYLPVGQAVALAAQVLDPAVRVVRHEAHLTHPQVPNEYCPIGHAVQVALVAPTDSW